MDKQSINVPDDVTVRAIEWHQDEIIVTYGKAKPQRAPYGSKKATATRKTTARRRRPRRKPIA